MASGWARLLASKGTIGALAGRIRSHILGPRRYTVVVQRFQQHPLNVICRKSHGFYGKATGELKNVMSTFYLV